MTTSTENASVAWHKALEPGELGEGRVKAVTLGTTTVAMTHHEGQYGALDNRCPHQGGPLGEGSIENGFLRCPWHGWDYCPLTGSPPGGYDDAVRTFDVEVREDGVYVAIPEPGPPARTVSDVLAETMTRFGVRVVFGMVGHSNLGFAAALQRQEQAHHLRYVGIRHEGAASFACSAYGKLTGRPAACLSIAGPGATNLLTGLWDANVDRSPVLAVTGQVDTQVLGPGAFQEVDLVAAFGKVAQWAQPVLPSSRPAELMTLALKHATLNRGVSHLILPDEVQTQTVPEETPAGSPEGRIPALEVAPPEPVVDDAIARIREAKRPVLVVGHGARFSMPRIVALAERLGAPVLTTFKGKGLVPDSHPLAGGVLGRSGTPIASWFMNEADLLVVIGASFSNHTGITPKKPTIQVDFEPTALGRFHAVDLPVLGEIGRTVELLEERLASGPLAAEDQRDEVAKRRAIWQEEKRRREEDDRGRGVASAALFAALTRHVPEDAILAVDVGNNTYSFGRYFECERQAVLMSGYLGSIGFALPAALGAWAATRETDERFRGRKVVSISGDGGFGQYMAELTTAVHHGMNITHVLLNNDELGKISKEQRAGSWPVWRTSLRNPDFAAYAELCGARGIRVDDRARLDGALVEALAHDGPSLVEVVGDPEFV